MDEQRPGVIYFRLSTWFNQQSGQFEWSKHVEYQGRASIQEVFLDGLTQLFSKAD